MTRCSLTITTRTADTLSRDVHPLRELTYFEEFGEETKEWVAPLKELLLEMRGEVERVNGEGGKRLHEERPALVTTSYDHLVAQGQRRPPPH